MTGFTIAGYGKLLGPTAIRVLLMLRDANEELAYERGYGYIGNKQVCGAVTFHALSRACAISDTVDYHTIYHRINETGLQILRDRGQ